MRNPLLLAGSIAVTILCWGLYGPVLRFGQLGMSTLMGSTGPVPSLLRPFVCVGMAYFLIGVIVPSLWLHFRGEKGEWTIDGIVWSLAGGAVGALGAFGIVLAFKFGGAPVYVMPLVFGGAPVVNAFLTVYLADRMKDIGPWFLAGLIMVVLGAVVVLLFAPHPPAAKPVATSDTTASAEPGSTAAPAAKSGWFSGIWDWPSRILAIALTIICWGAYGPVLHKGQVAMHHSRMRALICVGLAYFLIAVILPNMILAQFPEPSEYFHDFGATLLALAGGSVGALGALGIIFAFNFGGKPVFVMPLVFGGAPVINTLFTMYMMWRKGADVNVSPLFYAGMILVVAGSAMVLVMAPRGEAPRAAPALAT